MWMRWKCRKPIETESKMLLINCRKWRNESVEKKSLKKGMWEDSGCGSRGQAQQEQGRAGQGRAENSKPSMWRIYVPERSTKSQWDQTWAWRQWVAAKLSGRAPGQAQHNRELHMCPGSCAQFALLCSARPHHQTLWLPLHDAHPWPLLLLSPEIWAVSVSTLDLST